jgi:hypothetical protein
MPPTYPRLACPECGEAFRPAHHRQQFCSPEHAKVFNNRQLARGQKLVGLALAWRQARSTKDPDLKEAGKAAFMQLCRLLDAYAAEDVKAGRLNAVRLFRRRVAAGLLD